MKLVFFFLAIFSLLILATAYLSSPNYDYRAPDVMVKIKPKNDSYASY